MSVMAGLVPAMHVFSRCQNAKPWMPDARLDEVGAHADPARPGHSTSRVNIAVEIAKIGQPVHRQAVRVFFAFKIDLHQVLREALPGTLDRGTIGEGFVDA